MPLFYQHNINDSTKLAVWHITENEDFFLEKVSIQKEIMHPHKKLQHLAGRYLLEILHPEFPFHLIEIAESKKPLLSNGEIHFSISHCGEYAAAIVSENKLAGIDVELITPKIEMVKEKFLTENELKLSETVQNEPDARNYKMLTLFWSAKEAIYKWYGRGALSFKRNMGMDKLFLENEKGFINAHFIKDERIELKIEFRFSKSFAWRGLLHSGRHRRTGYSFKFSSKWTNKMNSFLTTNYTLPDCAMQTGNFHELKFAVNEQIT